MVTIQHIVRIEPAKPYNITVFTVGYQQDITALSVCRKAQAVPQIGRVDACAKAQHVTFIGSYPVLNSDFAITEINQVSVITRPTDKRVTTRGCVKLVIAF